MADQENDDDLFADLYDGEDSGLNDSAPTTTAPAAAVASEPAPVKSEPAPDATSGDAEATATEVQANYNVNEGEQDWDGNQDQDMTWQNDQSGQYNGAQQHDYNEDNEKPIGSKEDGKMFIGGLNWETTDQSLRDYFTQFGEVIECTVMRDSATGRSRGFGFLTFKDPKCVNTVMVKEHQLDGKIIDPKRAIPREEQERTSKIFVGGVSQEATETDFKQFFMKFGRVLDATLMMDKDTGRPRGFGFVTFDSEAAVDRTLQGPLEILGKPIEVKKAQPRGNIKEEENNNRFNRQKGPGFNGGGGGYTNGPMDGGAGGMPSMGGGPNTMTPNMMAQYWGKMQQYFQMMQQQMMAQGGGGGMNPMAMQGNPMMQQMMAMQQQQGGGGMSPQQMMQQMGGNGNRAAFNPQDQMAFEQQKYERASSGNPGQSSWDGMYDDVPNPGMGGFQQQGNGRGGFYGRGRGGGNFQNRGNAPVNAPAGAPTGPKNAGRPGANYRGGGRGGNRGFHPYARGGGGA